MEKGSVHTTESAISDKGGSRSVWQYQSSQPIAWMVNGATCCRVRKAGMHFMSGWRSLRLPCSNMVQTR